MLVINCLIVNNKNVHKNFKIQDMSNIRIRSRPTLLLAILSIFSLLIMLWNNSLKEYGKLYIIECSKLFHYFFNLRV